MSVNGVPRDEKADNETINIVVLCDGSLNRPTVETNVHILHKLLLSEVEEAKIRGISQGPELENSLGSWFERLKSENRKYQENREISDEAFRYEDHYYEAGAGEVFDLMDTIIADDIDNKIRSAYGHIVRRYNYDKNRTKRKAIWLFGFSRGAYT